MSLYNDPVLFKPGSRVRLVTTDHAYTFTFKGFIKVYEATFFVSMDETFISLDHIIMMEEVDHE